MVWTYSNEESPGMNFSVSLCWMALSVVQSPYEAARVSASNVIGNAASRSCANSLVQGDSRRCGELSKITLPRVACLAVTRKSGDTRLLKFVVTLKNTGSKDVVFYHEYPHARIGFRVHNPRGVLVDVIDYGEKVLSRWSSDGKRDHAYVGPGHLKRIHPGEEFAWEIDLRECFSMDEMAGEYKCTALVLLMNAKSGEGVIHSNEVWFSVNAAVLE